LKAEQVITKEGPNLTRSMHKYSDPYIYILYFKFDLQTFFSEDLALIENQLILIFYESMGWKEE
jgi:hypothetical protein